MLCQGSRRRISKVCDLEATIAAVLLDRETWSMIEEVTALDPWKSVSATSTLGRMGGVLQEKGYKTARTTIDAPLPNLASRSGLVPPIFSLSTQGVSLFNVAP